MREGLTFDFDWHIPDIYVLFWDKGETDAFKITYVSWIIK